MARNQTGSRPGVLFFGARAAGASAPSKQPSIAAVRRAAGAGKIDALIIDARLPQDFFRGTELLRALFDNPVSPRRDIHPNRVLALVADDDVEAAFALGRFGIAGVLEHRQLSDLDGILVRVLASTREKTQSTPLLSPPRPTWMPPDREQDLPTVVVGYRHAPATLEALARYQRILREHAHESTVFADVATLLEVMVDEGLTCQTNLAAKAGVTHTGQFIGSFEFYRQLRRTRYARIPDHPSMEINDDFLLSESNAESGSFWKTEAVFSPYATYAWVPYVIAQLPVRESYIGERFDLAEVFEEFKSRADASFLLSAGRSQLEIESSFDAYPPVPQTLRLGSRGPRKTPRYISDGSSPHTR